ncbi:MAG TPA: ABC transporter permease [Candidatus Eremiobacteraceae bacterium]|nr:ABC transporter permease [Candidatus Eremiobacteraceae bacterium]
MLAHLRELYKYRELLLMIVVRDIKVRYKQSVMGLFWAILMPVLIVCAGILVRYAYAIAAHKPLDLADVVSVAAKSVPWAFLVASIRFSTQSLIYNPNLVTKVYFPKEIFPIAAVLSQLFDLFIAGTVLAILLLVFKVGFGLQVLWVVPLLGILILLAIGIALLVSAGSLFYRDVKYIVEALLTFAIFFTPVFYEVAMLGSRGKWLLLNPAAPLLEGFSSITRGHTPNLYWLGYSLGFSLVTILFAYILFKKVESSFAESI